MKNVLYSLLFLFVFTSVQADPVLFLKKGIESGGDAREYYVYTPPTINAETGILVCLHGLNRNAVDFFDAVNVTPLAKALNLLIIAPQALPEKDASVVEQMNKFPEESRIPLNAVWGAGLYVNAVGSLWGMELLKVTAELNAGVDDVEFINAAIAKTKEEYRTVNAKRLYFLGTSLGAFMTYQYAMYHAADLAGIICVAGSMGTKIDHKANAQPVPVCDFHSIDDEVVYYEGTDMKPIQIPGISSPLPVTISLCEKKEDVITFWNAVNHSQAIPPIEQSFAESNGKSAKKYTYVTPGTKNLIHYRITGADHDDMLSNAKGDPIDYFEEIAAFILANPAAGLKQTEFGKLHINPNPVCDFIRLDIESGNISICDLSGKQVSSGEVIDGMYDVSYLQSGIYIVKILSGDKSYTGKMIKE